MSKRRILIIDDEADIVTLLSKGFEAYGYEVITAANGNSLILEYQSVRWTDTTSYT